MSSNPEMHRKKFKLYDFIKWLSVHYETLIGTLPAL
jgi:hypothetical protein